MGLGALPVVLDERGTNSVSMVEMSSVGETGPRVVKTRSAFQKPKTCGEAIIGTRRCSEGPDSANELAMWRTVSPSQPKEGGSRS